MNEGFVPTPPEKKSEEEKKMKDEELKAQINDIIEGEIQNGINDYLEAQEEKRR